MSAALTLAYSSSETVAMSLPAPLVPKEVDIRDFSDMPVDVARVLGSKFSATVDPVAGYYGMMLWFASWHRVPASSLPDDDRQLCHLAGLGRDLNTWSQIKKEALYGWIKCNDGNLYHPVIAEKALVAWMEKLHQRIKSGRGNAVRWGCNFSEESDLVQKFHTSWEMLKKANPSSKLILKGNPLENVKDKNRTPTGSPSGIDDGVPSQSQGKGREEKGREDNIPPIVPHDSELDKSVEPEPEEETAPAKASAECVESCFNQIWENMPFRKISKQNAQKAWARICRKKTDDQIQKGTAMITQDLRERAEHVTGFESPFWEMHLSTYLNQQRWKDEDLPERRRALPEGQVKP